MPARRPQLLHVEDYWDNQALAVLTYTERANWFSERHCGTLLPASPSPGYSSKMAAPGILLIRGLRAGSLHLFFLSLPQQPLQQKSPKLHFSRDPAFLTMCGCSKTSPRATLVALVLTSGQPSHLGQVVSVVTALLTSASPVLQTETKYSAKSYQHPDGVRSSCDGRCNTYLFHKDLISRLNSAGWRVLISSNTLCCCFRILCPHFSCFWCSYLDQLQLVRNLWIKDTSSGRWVSNLWP